jgi:hypothetical protein
LAPGLLLNVGARAETTASAGNDDRPDVIALRSLDHRHEASRAAACVEPLGTVECDEADVALLLEK